MESALHVAPSFTLYFATMLVLVSDNIVCMLACLVELSREGVECCLSMPFICAGLASFVMVSDSTVFAQWNPHEKEWNCPCHGSCFSKTGTNLMGPSTLDMTPLKQLSD